MADGIGVNNKRPTCHDSGAYYPVHKGKEAATMKIVDSAQQRNPEQIAKQLNSLVDRLKADVETAAQEGESFDFVERTVLSSVP